MPTPITITVVTGIRGGDASLDLQHEIELVKSALLYGDKVQLVSYNALAIAAVASAHVASGAVKRELFEKLIGERDPMSAALIDRLRDLRLRHAKSKAELLEQVRLEEVFRSGSEMLADSLAGIMGESGIGELVRAQEAGVFGLAPMGMDEGIGLNEGFVKRYSTAIEDLLTPGSGSFPLFDDDAGSLARSLVGQTGVTTVAATRAREVRIAGGLIAQLPAFADAPMAAVLDAREELGEPLVRFRAGINEVATATEEFPGDPDFGDRIRELWRTKVLPALDDLQELQRRRRPGALLTKALTSGRLGTAAGAVIAAVSASADSMPGLFIGAGVAAADVVSAAVREFDETAKSKAANRFVFLHETNRLLDRTE